MLGSVGAASLAPVLLKAATEPAAMAAPTAGPALRPAFSGILNVTAPDGQAAALRGATITGGSIDGARLAGSVQGGRIDWLARPDGGHELSLHFEVRCADGHLVEVCPRAIVNADHLTGRIAVTATVDSLSLDERSADAALLAGNLDATDLERGVLRLLAFEVA